MSPTTEKKSDSTPTHRAEPPDTLGGRLRARVLAIAAGVTEFLWRFPPSGGS